MKNIFNLALCVYIVGFALKFFHVHYNALLMIFPVLLMFIISIISALKRGKDLNPFLGFTITSWLAVLLFAVKYFPFVDIVLAVAAIVTIITFVFNRRAQLISQKVIATSIIVVALVFYVMPTDDRYYLLSIMWNHEIEYDFISWDKYSWHLYNNLNYKEALKASNTAKQIVDASESAEWTSIIAQHNGLIKAKKWNRYHN